MEATEGKGRLRARFGAAGLLGAGLLAGGILAGSHIAGAATNGSTAAGSASNTAAAAAAAARVNPAAMTHGPGETLLTDGTASKVEAAVPGATVIRVETDSGGAAYEAHMRKADGSYVTVKFDWSFKVTGIENGFGAGPQGAPSGNAGTGA